LTKKTITIEVTPSIMTDLYLKVPNAGVEYEAIIELSSVGFTPQDGSLHLGFPAKTRFGLPSPFRLGSVGIKAMGGVLSGLAPTLSLSGETVILSDLSALPPGPLSITLTGIRSPSSAESAPFLLQTLDANGLVLNQNPQALSVTPAIGLLREINMIFPPAGVQGNLNVTFATEGTLVNDGKIKIFFPNQFDLPYIPIRAQFPGGVLGAGTILEVETDRTEKVVTVSVLGGIPKGLLHLQLHPITIPVGFGSGTFLIQTADPGHPDRVVDQVDYMLVNTAELGYSWDPAMSVVNRQIDMMSV